MNSPRPSSILSHSIAVLLLAGAASTALASQNNDWLGTVSSDYDNPANWSLGRVPNIGNQDNPTINTTPANVATISVDEPQVVDIRVGETNTADSLGTLFHTAGTLASGGGNWTAIGAGTATSTGVYNLTNTTVTAGGQTGFGQGAGRLNANGRLYIGGTDDGSYGAGGIGTLNINSTQGVFGTDTVYLGVRGATGTVNVDSGTFTTSGFRMFVGEGAGSTGNVNLAGGTMSTTGDNNNGRIQVGDNGGTGNISVSGTGNLAASSDLILGTNGGTGTLNQTAGSISVTGGWAYVGGAFEGSNNSGTLNLSGGTFSIGTGRLYVGAGTGSTVGHMTVSGNAVFTNTDIFAIGAGSTTSTLDVSGNGKLNTGLFSLGGNSDNLQGGVGHGVMTVNGPTAAVNVTGEMQIGRHAGSTGDLTVTQGAVQSTGIFVIGQEGGAGTVAVNGANASLSTAAQLWVGQDGGSTGALTVSAGTVSSQSWIAVGRNGGSGVLTINGTGVVQKSTNDGLLELTNGNAGGSATVNLDGGSLIVNGVVGSGGGNSTQSLNLNGGSLVANADSNNFLDTADAQMNVFVKAGGAKFDTAGHNVTIGKPLLTDITSTGGGLIKNGVGELRLTSSTNSYTGPTMINAGTLTVAGSISGSSSVTVATGGNLLFGGNDDKIGNNAAVILAGGTLSTGGFNEGPTDGADGATAQLGVLTLGANSTIDFGNGATGSNLLFAGLNYTPGSVVSIRNWTGTAAGDTALAENDRLLFSFNVTFTDAQLASIQFYGDNGDAFADSGARAIPFGDYTELVAVPEPSVAVALAGGIAMMLGLSRQRRRLIS